LNASSFVQERASNDINLKIPAESSLNSRT